MKNAIVLAAGKGTRMRSDAPKVLHKVCEMPMAELIVRNLKKAGAERIIAVVGYRHELVEKALDGQCEFAIQDPQLGTGHAVMQARQLENETGTVLVVNGDAATIQPETLSSLYQSVEDADMAVLTVSMDDAAHYGRVIRSSEGIVEKIVEFKDCSEEEKAVHEINTGIYAFNTEKLFEGLKELKNNNAQHEYYITDLVEIFRRKGWTVKAVLAEDEDEVQGVNDNAELARANAWLRKKINEKWMHAGVTIIDPDNTYIGTEVKFGHDVTVHPNVSIYGESSIGNGTVIRPCSYLFNAVIGDDCLIDASVIENSTVESGSHTGPFANITETGEK